MCWEDIPPLLVEGRLLGIVVLSGPWVRVSKCFSKTVVDASIGKSASAALLLGVVICSGCPPWSTCYTLVFQGSSSVWRESLGL